MKPEKKKSSVSVGLATQQVPMATHGTGLPCWRAQKQNVPSPQTSCGGALPQKVQEDPTAKSKMDSGLTIKESSAEGCGLPATMWVCALPWGCRETLAWVRNRGSGPNALSVALSPQPWPRTERGDERRKLEQCLALLPSW